MQKVVVSIDYYLFNVLKNKTIHKIFMKGVNGFPFQATCFPVGEHQKPSTLTLKKVSFLATVFK